jgi:hypothetical protein
VSGGEIGRVADVYKRLPTVAGFRALDDKRPGSLQQLPVRWSDGTIVKTTLHGLDWPVPFNGCSMQIDLHGYHPAEMVWSGVLAKLVEQAWEMGERELLLIHGHGRNRGITPGFVNTNTGFFGLQIRSAFRHDKNLRRWIHHTTLDCSDPGLTSVSLKPNRSPMRTSLDSNLLPD